MNNSPAELAQLVARPAPSSFNSGLTSPRASFLLATFGKPNRSKLTTDCGELRAAYAGKIGSLNLGPFVARGHKVALQSLNNVLNDCRAAGRHDLVANVRSNGMLCVRKMRGTDSYSNHSWGLAIDLYFGDDPDAEVMGDGLVQRGLIELYPFFHARKWYAGLGYKGREDAMHFEPSVELIRDWQGLKLV